MRLIDADKGLISKIQRETGCNFITAQKIVDSMPTVEERKAGKWIRKPIRNDKGGCIGAEMICSCCNKDNRHDEYMDYCPNCGAEMVGAEND